jgi:hypothetical protein
MRDRLSGLGLYIGKDRTNTDENLLVRGGANVDDLQLAEISAAVGGTAVDVFVYDTSRDSDGGKWRERTQHTSWYNEQLNTATRGARREFPAVAVIVAEASKVTIYDGDDPDLSMWMMFENLGTLSFVRTNLSSVFASNGQLCIGNNGGLSIARFANDSGYSYFTSERRTWSSVVATRTELEYDGANDTSIVIVNNNINDVAMTVLPNAPVDDDTGLPVPTIAVATNSGMSVIKDDGTVVDIVYGSFEIKKVFFNQNNKLNFISSTNGVFFHNSSIPSEDISEGQAQLVVSALGGTAYHYDNELSGNPQMAIVGDTPTASNEVGCAVDSHLGVSHGGQFGISKFDTSSPNGYLQGSVAYITSKYNTGWMPGDIKLATLSDTTVENIGVNSDELVTNRGFDSDTSGWNQTASDWTVLNGVVSSSSVGSLDQEINCIIGQRYLVSFDITDNYVDNQNGVYIRKEDLSAYEERRVQDGSTGTFYFEFIANSSIHYIRLYKGASTGTLSFDNISVRATTELITNGDFSIDSDWTKGTGWSISGGVASISSSTAESHISQEIYVEAGKIYAFEAEVINRTNGIFGISWNNGTAQLAAENNVVNSRTSDGQLLRYFKASSSGTVTLVIYVATGATGSVDNASFREVELDRSVNNKALQIFGEIQKTPVAPGADLVAYSGFSANNYLVQPYNEDLNFGTGDFCVMGWANNSDMSNSYQTYISIGKYDNTKKLFIDNNNGDFVRFVVYDDESNVSSFNAQADCSGNSWNKFVMIRRLGVFEFYVNGLLIDSNNTGANFNFNTEDGVLLGVRHDQAGGIADDSSLALWRISATAPTAEQIAKIYHDEKVLFTDGAQATLYGTSDAVTALAYDQKTELLHVGTASGRSDFSGLRRINNTTTAITTSISAHNNLIAEQ